MVNELEAADTHTTFPLASVMLDLGLKLFTADFLQ